MEYRTVCLYGSYELMTKVLDFLCNHDYLSRLRLAVFQFWENTLRFSQENFFEEPMYYDGTFEELVNILPRERGFALHLSFIFSDVHWNEIKQCLEKYRGSDGLYHIRGFTVEAKEEPVSNVVGGVIATLIYRPEL